MKIIFFILLILSHSISYSQNNKESKIKVEVFENNANTEAYKKKEARNSYDKNYIFLNYTTLFRGSIMIGYERILSLKHSLVFGVGITYRDLIFEAFNRKTFRLSNLDALTFRPSYLVEFAYKFYPKTYSNFEGIYLSPCVSYKNYIFEYDYTPNTSNGGSTPTKVMLDGGYTMLEAGGKFGIMYEGIWNSDIVIDVYFGLGARHVLLTRPKENGQNTNSNPVNTDQTETINFTIPTAYGGFKVGFPF